MKVIILIYMYKKKLEINGKLAGITMYKSLRMSVGSEKSRLGLAISNGILCLSHLKRFTHDCTRKFTSYSPHHAKLQTILILLLSINKAMQCVNDMTYKTCGEVCADRVFSDQAAPSFNCHQVCIDGCHCPEDTKLWRGVCVPEVNCTHNGTEYIPGNHVDLEECTNW